MKDKLKPLTGTGRFAPRYWPSWIGVGLMRLLILLPYRLQLALGRLLGRLFQLLSPYRRAIVRANLELCFPEQQPRERRRLMDRLRERSMSVA